MWRNIVTTLYPDALHRTYRVPPEHFNRVPYLRDTVPGTGQSALLLGNQPCGAAPVHSVPPATQQMHPLTQYSLWTQESQPQATPVRVQESDYRDDLAQRYLLANLQALGDAGQEPMFIMSQLSFGDYLNEPSYAAAVKASQLPKLPRPSDLGTKYKAGDFDILLIHRRYGILVGELKSVGVNQPGASKTPAQADDDVAKRVGRAVKQLDKSEAVVKHLVSDIAPGQTVRKTLFLPYVSSTQLQQVLSADPQLEQVHTHTQCAHVRKKRNSHTHTHTHIHNRTHTYRCVLIKYTNAHTYACMHSHNCVRAHTHTRTRMHALSHTRTFTLVFCHTAESLRQACSKIVTFFQGRGGEGCFISGIKRMALYCNRTMPDSMQHATPYSSSPTTSKFSLGLPCLQI